MCSLRGKDLAMLAIVIYVVFFSYRYYARGNDAAALQQTTLEHSIQRMAVISPKLLPPEGTITLPGNIQAGYEMQIYAQVSGSGEGSSGASRDLFTVADVSKMRLFVSVPEAFGPFLQPGLTADVTVPHLPNRHFTGKFLTVAHEFDVSTRTAITVFEIDNEDGALWPGSYATVRIMAPVDKNILTIPTTSLAFQEHGAQIAMVSEDDRVPFKPIAVSRVLDNAMEITEGISAEGRIIHNLFCNDHRVQNPLMKLQPENSIVLGLRRFLSPALKTNEVGGGLVRV